MSARSTWGSPDATGSPATHAAIRAAAWRFVLQRASAAVLALCVVVHLATIIYAVRHGLTSDAIVARMHANPAWPAFYAVFVVAAAIHAPLGLRAIADEWLGLARTRRRRRARPLRAGAARRRPLRRPRADRRDGPDRSRHLRDRAASNDAPQRRARAVPSGVLGVRRASRIRHRADAVPAGALLRAVAGAVASGGARRVSSAGRISPRVKLAETLLVLALAAHLGGGVRLLFIEFAGWRAEWQKTALALVVRRGARRTRCCSRWRPDERLAPMTLRIDPARVEDAAKELYIRALKMLPPDVKRGFDALAARETDATAKSRPRRHGAQHRRRRADRQPAVPGHRPADLQRHDRPRRRRRRRRAEGGDPPRLRARDARVSAALVGRASADAAATSTRRAAKAFRSSMSTSATRSTA